MTLLEDLREAERANQHAGVCKACETVRALDGEVKQAVLTALSGTIGEQKLADILAANGHPTGRRAIRRHRREDHTP